jgi:small subunit ribosomal protein S16
MLKIRLKRVGRKHDPSYRVVLIDSHSGPKSGKINEILGFYDPRKDIKELKGEEIKAWISKGAQVSDTVHNILVGEKVIEGKKINVLPRKSPIVKEEESKEEKVPEAAPAEATEAPVAEAETPAETTDTSEAEAPKEEAKTEESPAEPEAPVAEKVEEEPKEEEKAEESPKEEKKEETKEESK